MANYYKSQRIGNLTFITPERRLAGQMTMWGTDPTISVPKGIFFLELLEASSGTITITDGEGKTIMSGVSSFNQEHSPLRCDLGVTLTGDVAYAKGFTLDGIFIE